MHSPNLYVAALSHWLAGRTSEVISHLADPEWTWEQFVERAATSAILPALQTQLADPRLHRELPDEIVALLSTVHVLNSNRNRVAIAQARELTAALNQVGIQPVALKGLAHILLGIYPDVGSRYLADIDLMIPNDQFPAAASIFKSLGYMSEAPAHPLDLIVGHAYPPFTRPESVEVDLHRATGLGICASFLPASEVIRHSTLFNLDGAAIRVPSIEDLVVHHIMHSQMHSAYRERISPSLRTLYDFLLLDRLSKSNVPGPGRPGGERSTQSNKRQASANTLPGNLLDWSAIEARFRQRGQYDTFALYLLQVESSLALQPPVDLQLSLALRLRRRRRQLFQNRPALRFLDPLYYVFAGFRPRSRRVREILSHPGGRRYLLWKLFRPKFYSRLLSDMS